jgi:DNA-binding NarL/FixJ family response regulator
MAKRLLVVDDEPRLLRAVAVTLTKEGFDVTTARSGAEALVRINESIPDLVVSDVRMPELDGQQLALSLRSHPRTEHVPIVFLTAKDDRKDRLAGLRLGVDAYLTKPFDPEELVAVIRNILGRVERTSAELARLVMASRGATAPDRTGDQDPDFTDAESRIVGLVATGLSNKEIAAELGISVRTVEGHISNVLSKKGWSNRVEIARHVIGRRPAD